MNVYLKYVYKYNANYGILFVFCGNLIYVKTLI